MMHDILMMIVSFIFIVIALAFAWFVKIVDQLVKILIKFLEKRK